MKSRTLTETGAQNWKNPQATDSFPTHITQSQLLDKTADSELQIGKENPDIQITAISSGKSEPGPHNVRWDTKGDQQLKQKDSSSVQLLHKLSSSLLGSPSTKELQTLVKVLHDNSLLSGENAGPRRSLTEIHGANASAQVPESPLYFYSGLYWGHPSPERQRLSTMKSAAPPLPELQRKWGT